MTTKDKELVKLIMSALIPNDNGEIKAGIKFLIDFLKNSPNPLPNPKYTVYDYFLCNVKNLPKLDYSTVDWKYIIKSGNTYNSIESSFDWDLAPENIDFWDDLNARFNLLFCKAQDNGLKFDEFISFKEDMYKKYIEPMIGKEELKELCNGSPLKTTDNSTVKEQEELPQNINVSLTPDALTIKFFRHLCPFDENDTIEQVKVINKVLEDNKCKDDFYYNLRVKPKFKGFEKEFNSMMNDGDLRTIVYWAFNWSNTTQGFAFWSYINGLVHKAITNEIVNGYGDNSKDLPTHKDYVFPLIRSEKKETYLQENKQETKPPYRSESDFPYRNSWGSCHYPCEYDEYWDDYDDYYEDYGYWYYNNKKDIPKDILKMPITTDKIEVNIFMENTPVIIHETVPST